MTAHASSATTRFPPGFLWGAATSAHQVEGGCTNNNWYAFESARDPAGHPRILLGQRAGNACEQWTRYHEDIVLLKNLGLNAYRFSVEWSKIEPRPGCVDESAMAHYEEVVDALLEAGITPMVTLHHFTNPLWFEERGGFVQPDSPDLLARFARLVFERLADRVCYWCTVNEPSVYAINGYVTGEFPPGESNLQRAGIVLGNLMRAHSAMYACCKAHRASAQIGLATNVFVYEPDRWWHPLDRAAAWLAHTNFNREILRYLVRGEMRLHFPAMLRLRVPAPKPDAFDFVGLNYYTRFHLRFSPDAPGKVKTIVKAPPGDVTDMQWEIYPEGLLRAIRMIADWTPKPVYITENGIADDSDTKRGRYLRAHLERVRDAFHAGIDVRGFFCWSLLDNFEWAFGYARRFGLYHVDFVTQKRTLRKGSEAYPEFIRSSGAQ